MINLRNIEKSVIALKSAVLTLVKIPVKYPNTVTIWILDTLIPDSSEYRTLWVSSILMVKSCDLANHLNTGHLGP